MTTLKYTKIHIGKSVQVCRKAKRLILFLKKVRGGVAKQA